MAKLVWLSTFTSLRVCSSIAQAVALGAPGDHIVQFCSECEECRAGTRCNRMAGKASHVIRETRTGKKQAVRLA